MVCIYEMQANHINRDRSVLYGPIGGSRPVFASVCAAFEQLHGGHWRNPSKISRLQDRNGKEFTRVSMSDGISV
jgi:hypothetical protein